MEFLILFLITVLFVFILVKYFRVYSTKRTCGDKKTKWTIRYYDL